MRLTAMALLGVVALAGCGREGPLRIWAASDMLHLTDRSQPVPGNAFYDEKEAVVNLHAAANETVSFQLVIDALAGAGNISLSAAEVAGPNGKKFTGVQLFRMLPVVVEAYPAWFIRLADRPVEPERFYDPLVPLAAGKGIDLPAKDRLAVWVDLAVPRDALPGEYSTAITVQSGPIGSSVSQTVSVRLKVHDFVLPDSRPVNCIGAFSWQSIFSQFIKTQAGGKPFLPGRLDPSNKDVTRGLMVLRQLMQLAHQHRLDLVETSLRPVLKRDPAGKVTLDWADYDLIVKPYLDGTAFDDRLGCPAWPAPLCAAWPDPADYGEALSENYQQTVRAVAAESVRHFEKLGASEKLFFWPRVPADPAGRSETYHFYDENCKRFYDLARLARVVAPRTPILSELPLSAGDDDIATPPDMSDLADMLAPPANQLDVTMQPAGRGGLCGNYLRPGQPPYIGSAGILGSPADVRSLAYIASRYRAGIFLGEVLNWSGDPYKTVGTSEARLFYPGNALGIEGVLPSVRLKRLRRSLQDAAYLHLLQDRNRAADAESIVNLLVRYAAGAATGDNYLDGRLDGYVRDGEVYVAARKLLADQVLTAVHPELFTPQAALRQRVAWREIQQRAGRIRLEQARCRLEPLDGGRYRVTAALELFNELGGPADVEIAPGALPAGWKSPQERRTLKAMPAGQVTRLEWVFEGTGLPATAGGKIAFPLTLAVEGRPPEQLVISAAVLSVPYAAKPPTIDGDLADWPLRGGSCAGEFVVLGRRGRCGENQTGLAANQTLVFAQYDEQNLYLAFRCAQPAAPTAQPSNIVSYQQLLACGEDMVEVLVDPGRGGKAAEDLFHLAVKCNGATLAERGVQTDPPLGKAQPWPLRAKIAVGKNDKAYFVEMAIPLEALGRPAAGHTGETPVPPGMWNINFARFSTAGQESSNWCGAARYLYNPLDLGTMIFLPKAGK